MAYLGLNQVRQSYISGLNTRCMASLLPTASHSKFCRMHGTSDVSGFVSALHAFQPSFQAASFQSREPTKSRFGRLPMAAKTGLLAGKAMQEALYAAVKARYAFTKSACLQFHFWHGSPTIYAPVGNMQAWCTYGTAHVYPQTSMEEALRPIPACSRIFPGRPPLSRPPYRQPLPRVVTIRC